jgi:hypothetical protein
LIVIDIGIDESKSGSTLVLSAIIGKTGSMEKLDTEWSCELKRSGVDYFHAKDHWNRSFKPYHGISRDEREMLLARLIGHLHHRFLFGASTTVDEAEYRETASERFRSQYGSPYGWGFQMLMVLILLELKRQGKDNQPVNILIEDGHANARQVIGLIDHKKELHSKKGLKEYRA